MAVCISMMLGRFGSVASTNIIGFLLERNCELTYYIFSSFALICFGVSFVIPNQAKKLQVDKKEIE
jgi:MFS transporter, VNT family, synaptic vesicle glycoprotein 2